MLKSCLNTLILAVLGCYTGPVLAASQTPSALDIDAGIFGILALLVFVLAYVFVIAEEMIHLRKSKPVLIAAGAIWILVGVVYTQHDQTEAMHAVLDHDLLEYVELLLFLLAAMTFINTLEERRIFDALRARMVSGGYSLRTIFWMTGAASFLLSPVADNLTTALVMGAVVVSVGRGNLAFISVACINVVVAANAGGAFSPFGDITTLMVWQRGLVEFQTFFHLVIPSLVNWLVPAVIMSLTIAKEKPEAVEEEVRIKRGGYVVALMFLGTITLAVSMHNFFHLPPMIGMMTGLGVLKVYGYFIRRGELHDTLDTDEGNGVLLESDEDLSKHYKPRTKPFDIFISMKRAEWDTLMFFYGVILCVGGLGALGYLAVVSQFMYTDLGPTWANVLVGVLSAIVDNIPVMFAVLSMNPEMSLGQWLLVTLTAGVGGSMLSVGSAAGVALMGQARGYYTFFGHLKWTWAIALGYGASIWVHLLVNGSMM